MNLGTESRNKTIAAATLGVLAVLAMVYLFSTTSSSSPASSSAAVAPVAAPANASRHGSTQSSRNKPARPDSLDPTLRLDLLASSEQIHYSGSGRNIFLSQADPEIPKPKGTGATDQPAAVYVPPMPPQPPPINLKFFGFANKAGEPKRVFLSQGEDVFIAGEGDIVNRRYKVVRISTSSVEIQDVLSSGPAQTIQLTQG